MSEALLLPSSPTGEVMSVKVIHMADCLGATALTSDNRNMDMLALPEFAPHMGGEDDAGGETVKGKGEDEEKVDWQGYLSASVRITMLDADVPVKKVVDVTHAFGIPAMDGGDGGSKSNAEGQDVVIGTGPSGKGTTASESDSGSKR